MQKKLHLAVLALCIATTAFAQESVNTSVAETAEQAIIDEQAFTFTEAQLGEDDDMAQNVSIISSNQNITCMKRFRISTIPTNARKNNPV